ncbi:PIN domain-containing protein [Paraburkholderia sediminicola]|uniref:PIN domain-containing protein n=1 Tax=Paraburkholderia TaxID=1822464 RepID=UPI0038B81311
MRSSFAGYYPPTADELSKLWLEGTIVLDTNVLLDLYRLPQLGRDALLAALARLKGRLWIPHHVALEYQRRRLSAIWNERSETEKVLASFSATVDDARKKLQRLELEKRGIDVDVDEMLRELETANTKIVEAVRKAHNEQMDISSHDPVRTALDDLLGDGCVGLAPENQESLNSLIKDGEQRYIDKIPPGYRDAGKGKNPADAYFLFDGLKYERQYGDLIIWRQLLNHAKENKTKLILFITSDRKEDWWWEEHGRTLGPRPELVREIKAISDVEHFWMYSADQLLKHAASYLGAEVSEQAVTQVEDISHAREQSHRGIRQREGVTHLGSPVEQAGEWAKFAFLEWLEKEKEGDYSAQAIGFPDILGVDTDEGAHGYEVRFIKALERTPLRRSIEFALAQGYAEVSQGKLDAFTVVVVLEFDEQWMVVESEAARRIRKVLFSLVRKYPLCSALVGFVGAEGFSPVSEINSSVIGSDYDADGSSR